VSAAIDPSRVPGTLRTLTIALWAAAALGSLYALTAVPPLTDQNLTLLVVLAGVGFVTEVYSVRLSDHVEASAGGVAIIVAAVTLGPLAAGLVGFCELLADVTKPPLAKWAVHAPLRTLCGLVAGACASAVSSNGILIAVLAAAVGHTTVDLVGNAAISWVRGMDLRDYLRGILQTYYFPLALYLPLVAVIVSAQRRAGIAAIILVFGPILLAQYIYWLVLQRSHAYDTLTEANLSFVIGMIRALEAADKHTAGHSEAVGVYARDTALELGLSPSEAAVIQLAALLHDVGKIGVPSEILRKPTPLTDDEWKQIRQHPITGERIVREVPVFRSASEAIRHHHERPDGKGYPDHLGEGQISEAAAIIGVVDAYSAMIQPRAYRHEPFTPEMAMEELLRWAGSQFELSPTRAFLSVLARAQDEDYRYGRGAQFQIDRQRVEILESLGHATAVSRGRLAA
jgi:HD-GYP domain-containing protein (c-di-GMP phosphodiesterase class II)